MTDPPLPDSSELNRDDFTRSRWKEVIGDVPITHCADVDAGFVGLKVCTELPDSFFRMKGYAGAGPGLFQGDRVAVEPSVKPPRTFRENRRKTGGKPSGNRW